MSAGDASRDDGPSRRARQRQRRSSEFLARRPSRREIDEEIRHHLEGRIEELVAAGHDRATAEREARRRFGDAARVRRATERVYRRAPSRPSPVALLSELAGAFQSLRRRPGFTVTAILLLAIGIGTATAMLGVLDAYLLRGMPYPAAERLAWVRQVPADPRNAPPTPPPVDWRRLPEIELAVAWDLDAFTLLGDGRPEVVSASWVPPDYFRAFGIQPALGRGFAPDELGPGAEAVAVIGHALWQTRFGGDPGVLGRTIRMYASDRPEEAAALTIVGVLPADWWGFNGPYTQILVPLSGLRTAYIVRVAEGTSLQEAAARMSALAADAWGPEYTGWQIQLVGMHERHVRSVRPLLGGLAAAVALVLLITCANVAVLLVVQASARSRELAVRAALGAGRRRLAVRLLLEAGLLALAGATLGLLLAGEGLGSLGPSIEQQLGTVVPGGTARLALSPRVALMGGGLTVLVTLLFGLAPLAAGIGRDLSSTLTGSARTATGSARQHRLRTGLIVMELALSLALLAGAGLTVRSALHLAALDLGFDSSNLLRAGMGLSAFRYPGPESWSRRIDETLQAFRATPGVAQAAAAWPPPLSPTRTPVQPLDGLPGDAGGNADAAVRRVSTGYFDTLGISLLRGRDFDPRDTRGAEPVAIVSDRLVAQLWPGQEAIGRSVRVTDPMDDAGNVVARRVVGVVTDTREGLADDVQVPDAYVPLAQAPVRWVTLLVRSPQPPDLLVPTLEARVWEQDPEQPLTGPSLVQERVQWEATVPRALARLLTGFAAFGVLLAVVGVYGVVAFAARQRRRELAVRVALGAAARDVRRLVLWQGARLVGAGLLLGLGAAGLVARSLASQMHGVSAGDPLTFIAVTLLLGAAACAGIVVPARRAAAADPMELLREE